MPMLSNAKHELFAQEIAKGKTADEAYKIAGYKPDRGNAARLTAKDNIKARVAELLGRVAEGVVISRQWVLERLVENANRAMQAEAVMRDGVETGEYRYEGSVANRALELVGKELGMFVDRKEVGRPGEFESMDADQLREYIRHETEELGLSSTAAAESGNPGKPH